MQPQLTSKQIEEWVEWESGWYLDNIRFYNYCIRVLERRKKQETDTDWMAGCIDELESLKQLAKNNILEMMNGANRYREA